MAKTCLIIMDGVRFDTCISESGYLEGSVEEGQAKRWKMQSCLPSISAPLYETIHTGLAPHAHGILGNEGIRPSRCPNIFYTLKNARKTAAVAGHSYFHTLYGGNAFDPFEHCEINDPSAPIPYARYYSMEGYRPANSCMLSEIDLCAQLWGMAQRHDPDYLLMHSPSADTLGHWFTSNSPEYRTQVWQVDNALSRLIPRLLGKGYEVLVTADHGMNEDGHHGGNQPKLREVPFYYFGSKAGPKENTLLDQRAIAPSILSLIGVPAPQTMNVASLF